MSTEKNIQEIKSRLNSVQVDYDFYSTGFPFYAAEAKSANHVFGNGKWKKTCIDAFGEDFFKTNCDKYGNKPIDLKITKFKTQYAKYFRPNEIVTINDGVIAGEKRVLEIDGDGIVLMIPFSGDANGTLKNQSQIKGTKKAIDKYNQMLKDMQPTNERVSNINPFPKQGEISQQDLDRIIPPPAKPKTNTKKIIITIVAIVAIFGIGYAIYKQSKNSK